MYPDTLCVLSFPCHIHKLSTILQLNMFVILTKHVYMCRKDNSYQKSGGASTVFVKGFDRSLDENQVDVSIDDYFFYLTYILSGFLILFFFSYHI
jgi:hypothetical protein